MDDAPGAVLPIWKVLAEQVIPAEDKKLTGDLEGPKGKDHARVVRLKLDSGEPIIGLSLMSDDVQKVNAALAEAPAFTAACTYDSLSFVMEPMIPLLRLVLHFLVVRACMYICCPAEGFGWPQGHVMAVLPT